MTMELETQKPIVDIHMGQVWMDNDKRQQGRRSVKVIWVDRVFALCEVLYDGKPQRRRTLIRLRRFRPTSTGYRLVSDGERICVRA